VGIDNVVSFPQLTLDASARVRTSEPQTLGDYKTLGADNLLLLENTTLNVGAGTTTGIWGSNKFTMHMVNAENGSYSIRKTRIHHNYFSGKSSQIEITFEHFHPEVNVVKRAGYFSSNTATPYDSSKDGFLLESSEGQVWLKIFNTGTLVHEVPQTEWNVDTLLNHDWSRFNVIMFDFLWLGGVVLRLFVMTATGFKHVHTYIHASSASDVVISSPNQPIRWEMRATGGATGTFTPICAQYSTEGEKSTGGIPVIVRNNGNLFVGVTAATIGTTYTLIAVRKNSAFRDKYIKYIDYNMLVTTADQLEITIVKNPTFAGTALSFLPVTDTGIDAATPIGALASTVTGGRVLHVGNATQNAVVPPPSSFDDYLSYLGTTINGVSDVIALCVTPLSTSVTLRGSIRFREF
jgi:hypothetical protein